MKRFDDLPKKLQTALGIVLYVLLSVSILWLFSPRMKTASDAGAFFLELIMGVILYGLFIGVPVAIRSRQEEKEKAKEEAEKGRQERAELQERILQLQQELEEKDGDANEARYVAGYEAGVTDGLAKGREEGYSLGHSEGYKFALYTQNRFRYYNGDPPLTYEEARRSLDEGADDANGELVEPPKKPRTRKKKAEPEIIE